jgi:prevent-host-death family protein
VLTITTHEAKTHLSRYLAAVEQGEQFVIARGKKPIARLVPVSAVERPARPKVGEILGPPFEFPASAFAPLSKRELRKWGL